MQHFKGNVGGSSSLQQMLSNPIRKKPVPQLQPHQQGGSSHAKEKFMRLRGKMRILQNAFLQSGDIADRDADVVFVCADGKVRAHKVILVTASPFFNDLFLGQKAGSMSSVIVPDISAATMKVILLLAYKDNLNLTKKQMKDVALHLSMFGMDLKSFVFDENNLGDPTVPSRGMQHQIRRPPPMTSRPNPPPLQQPIQRQIGSITISGAGVQPGIPSRTPIGTSSSGDDDDYKLGFQGYDSLTPPPLKQIRVTANPQGLAHIQMKKATPVNVGNFRRIAPKPPAEPDLLPIQPAMNMTVGNQEIQFEDTDEDDGQVLDPEQGRLMIQEWMKNVGQQDDDDGTSKRPGVAISGSPPHPQKNQCLICNNVFDNPEKWRWHESHHVGLGIFKCAFCDELFSTSRKVYQHEMMEHGISGSATPLDEPPGIPSDFQIVQGRKRRYQDDDSPSLHGDEAAPRMTLVRTANGTHYRRIPTPISKKLLSKYTKKPNSGGGVARNMSPMIGIGSTEGADQIEDRKMKQLHWVYVCNKCQTCSDSVGKAQHHYNKCFLDKTIIFESSVMKYRQGFYGRCRCPLCPRRYTTNHGFTIHCGHMHNDFRRKFQHCSQNDTISCISCRKKFELPIQFHAHLGEAEECHNVPEYSALDKGAKWIGNETPGERKSPPSAKSKAGTVGTTPKTTPGQSSIAHGRTVLESQARSTRLANRRTMTHEADIPEEEYLPAECPICGSQENKIVEHLHSAHKEMELSVSRISNTALRCLKCAISFGITDLVSHDTYCCIRSKQFQHVKERKLQHPKESQEKEKTPSSSSANGVAANPPIPEGIGTSPVDTMENYEHLTSPEVIRKAMRCGICGRINSKLGTISECLRSHGIYRCALCFNSYTDKSIYSSHLRRVHTQDNGRLKCPLCDKALFVNAGQVAGHLLNAHWLPVFRQIFAEDKEASKKINVSKAIEDEEMKSEANDSVLEKTASSASNDTITGPADSIEIKQELKEGDEDEGQHKGLDEGQDKDKKAPDEKNECDIPDNEKDETISRMELDEPKSTTSEAEKEIESPI